MKNKVWYELVPNKCIKNTERLVQIMGIMLLLFVSIVFFSGNSLNIFGIVITLTCLSALGITIYNWNDYTYEMRVE